MEKEQIIHDIALKMLEKKISALPEDDCMDSDTAKDIYSEYLNLVGYLRRAAANNG